MGTLEARGAPTRVSAGSWIDDLTALKKCIMLCWKCEKKFKNYKKYGYERKKFICPGQQLAIGTCDGCKDRMTMCRMFLSKSVERL